jgi:hypothetical protein
MGSHHQDIGPRAVLPNVPQDVHAIDIGHPEIGDDDIEWRYRELCEREPPRSDVHRLVPTILEHLDQHTGELELVIDNQDPRH